MAALTPSPIPECTSLIAAVKDQDISLTHSCLQQGQNVNQTDINGLSPLNYAASYGNIDILAELLEAGSEVSLRLQEVITAASHRCSRQSILARLGWLPLSNY